MSSSPNNSFINELKNADTEQLFELLSPHGELRFIGGCVRDAVLNIAFNDIDLATSLLPDQVIKLLESANIKVVPTGLAHGTVTAIFDQTQYQITTLRKDVACDGRHAEVLFTDDWQEDAARRDFTINALSANLNGEFFDYFSGLTDLKAKKVRFIGNAADRICEDYLRILRFYRFAGKYGEANFDPETCQLCTKYSSSIDHNSSERIYDELEKMALHLSFNEVFKKLDHDKILAIIFPEVSINHALLESLKLVSQRLNYQPNFATILAAAQYGSSHSNISLLKKKNDHKLFTALTNFDYGEYHDIEHKIKRFHYITGEKFKNFFIILFALHYKIVYHQLMEDLFFIYTKKERNIFPVDGKDLLEMGYKDGLEIGHTLARLESLWIESDFYLGKLELLKQIEK